MTGTKGPGQKDQDKRTRTKGPRPGLGPKDQDQNYSNPKSPQAEHFRPWSCLALYSPLQVKQGDKFSFLLGVLILVLGQYLVLRYPTIIPSFYTAVLVGLVANRLVFRK